ncbi:phosphoglyceromutase [Hymenobacter sp. UV11]|uniref:alkaline phosphatase family protein n=1 Tax=Hymenobacter sp. UV11 TaxID=1849735 RepID=UPI00105B28E5|nr:alkaline phosphatase family protein [Hymenobacter sp. UV11]TDN40575.1 hypothetical protein A8B98_14225 [Hymenobacter sp. UV11]TFZ66408.1 phosphoglyceromutase [Hymenobacter sp. UV11]
MSKALLTLLLLATLGRAEAQAPDRQTENLILVTIDGVRWQEIFGGADSVLLRRRHPGFSTPTGPAGSPATAAHRRQALLPFLWRTVASKGQLHGNRAYGNYLNVTNKQRLSYPGYNELLTGRTSASIRSNAKVCNPNETVLAFINQQPAYRGQVRVFASWETFAFILNAPRHDLPVNAGRQSSAGPLGTARPDSLTFRCAFEAFKREQPRVLYLALGDTDEFAHRGEYGQYLAAAHAADQFLAQLWAYVQATPRYRGKTTLVITTDHGRGRSSWGRWAHHSRLLAGSDQIWLGVLGPDTPPTGEQQGPAQLYQNQLATTLAALLGLHYGLGEPLGAPIRAVLAPGEEPLRQLAPIANAPSALGPGGR